MEPRNLVIDVVKLKKPIIVLPKKCTALETDTDMSNNVFIQVNITTPDTEGNQASIYTGLSNVKLVGPFDDIEDCEDLSSDASLDNIDIEQMPIIFSEPNPSSFPSYKQSEVWIDPSRSPYVYNRCDTPTQERCIFYESGGHVTVKQHNTYITQNIYNYAEPKPVFTTEQIPQTSYSQFEGNNFDHNPEQVYNSTPYTGNEYVCNIHPPQSRERIVNEQENIPQVEQFYDLNERNALKQLMSQKIQSGSKQRKTILFLGNDSQSGQTIQNMSYCDPTVRCPGLEVDHEVIIDDSVSLTPKKKKYQCDFCKQLFDQISEFHKHMVGSHSNYERAIHKSSHTELEKPGQNAMFCCSRCGKTLKTLQKFEIHWLGHGDPDLECPKCLKVYASKCSLRTHLKIHNRKFHCRYCRNTYATITELKNHEKKQHMVKSYRNRKSLMDNKPSETGEHHQNLNTEDIGRSNFVVTNEEACVEDSSTENPGLDIQINMTIKSDDSDSDGLVSEEEGERIKNAESVIAKVKSNKMFLLNSKRAKMAGKTYNKTCVVCCKTFERISDLKRHLIEHIIRSTLAKSPATNSGILNIVCEICKQYTFTETDKYKEHLREHAKLTIYKCMFCDKSFSDSSNFCKHKKVHGTSYFQCDLCLRKFHSKQMITKHMETHRKNKPVKCRICHKIFYFRSMLNKHIRSTHARSRNVKYNCRFCADSFKTLKDKWDHEWMIHNIRKIIVDCQYCDAKFRKYTELKRHCFTAHGKCLPQVRVWRKAKRKMYYY